MRNLWLLAFLVGCSSGVVRGEVVITEVMYNPAGDDGWSATGNTEYIEILNVGPGIVDVENWVVCDAQGTCMPASGIGSIGVLGITNGDFMLAPGDFAVLITEDTALGTAPCIADYQAAWGIPAPPAAEIIVLVGFSEDRGVQLNNTATDMPLSLYDSAGTLIDQCIYSGGVGQGVALYICTSPPPTTASNDSLGDWNEFTPAYPIPAGGFVTNCAGDSIHFGPDMGTPGLPNDTSLCGPGCNLTVITMPTPVAGDIVLELATSSAFATVDATLEWSSDGGVSWATCTMGAASPNPNPAFGLTPGTLSFAWDSVLDAAGISAATAVTLRAAVSDSSGMSVCLVATMVDNRPPPPTCAIVAPLGGSTVGGDVLVAFDTASAIGGMVDLSLAWSSDAGATWNQATMDTASALVNPVSAVSTGSATMLWDSRADGLGMSATLPVEIRLAVADASPRSPSACALSLTLDNTALCNGICGDCDLNSVGPSIIDALVTAQLAAGLLIPTARQASCCDVDSSGIIAILDALKIAQVAAGLPVALGCP